MSLSTREQALPRDGLFAPGVTSVSAESSTQPGGYAENGQELKQFSIDDTRATAKVAEAVRVAGLQPVWRDWLPGW